MPSSGTMCGAGRLFRAAAVCGALMVPACLPAQYRYTADDVALRSHFDDDGWAFVARQPCRALSWRPDTTSISALASSAAPVRRELGATIGQLPPFVGTPDILSDLLVYQDDKVVVRLVVIEGRFPRSVVTGYLAIPRRTAPRRPAAVVIHGSFSSPEQVFGWRAPDTDPRVSKTTPISGIGTELLAQGIVVFAPLIDADYSFEFAFPWAELNNLGESFNNRTRVGDGLTFAVAAVQAGVELVRGLPGSAASPVMVVGWEEGAFIGSMVAALDPSIVAVVNLMPPHDERLFRGTVAGVRVDSPFAHHDCTFGRIEQAALIAPRPLLYAWSDDDLSALRVRQFRSAATDSSLADLYRVAGKGRLGMLHATRRTPSMTREVARWSSRQLQSEPIADSLFLREPQGLENTAHLASAQTDSLAMYVGALGGCRQIPAEVDASNRDVFRTSADRLRESVRQELGLRRTPLARHTRVVLRQLLPSNEDYTLEWIVLRSDGEAREIGGLLATPRLPGPRHAAVLSFDGNYGVAQVFGLPPFGRTDYLHAYGDDFARAGVVVFAPYRPTLVSRVPSQLRGRGSGTNRLEYEIDLARASMDFLLAQPTVDSSDVIAYGISEAAYSAVYATAFDQRITGVVYSNPHVSHRTMFSLPQSSLSGTWQTQSCGTMDATMKYLIAPRRFTWEGDETDLSFYPEPVLSFPRSIATVYTTIGAGGAFNYRRHLYGHSTRPMEMIDALPFRRRIR